MKEVAVKEAERRLESELRQVRKQVIQYKNHYAALLEEKAAQLRHLEQKVAAQKSLRLSAAAPTNFKSTTPKDSLTHNNL